MDTKYLPPELQSILRSSEAKQLMKLLNERSDNIVQKASAAAHVGNEAELKSVLQLLLQDPQLNALITKIKNQTGV